MWFNKKKPPPIRSLVGDGMVVQGSMRFTEGLRIDGQVFGDVVADGEGRSILVISDNARVHGRVAASHVIINGEVHSPLDELRKRKEEGIAWPYPPPVE